MAQLMKFISASLKIFFKRIDRRLRRMVLHWVAILSKRYYFEDYVRVYPEKIAFDKYGRRRIFTENDKKNYLNHRKFYFFASQFINHKKVCDIGCGTGYGCKILKEKGANLVMGTDISKHSIEYARRKFGKYAEFSIQPATNLKLFQDDSFNVSISSEVLEHLKEYTKEDVALKEMIRVTKNNGLIIIGTSNSELLGSHGFYFRELSNLLKHNFKRFIIFENALLPFSKKGIDSWKRRLKNGNTGIIITQNIHFSETVLPPGKQGNDLIKQGIASGSYKFYDIEIDTGILHNTHSFIAIAINEKSKSNMSGTT